MCVDDRESKEGRESRRKDDARAENYCLFVLVFCANVLQGLEKDGELFRCATVTSVFPKLDCQCQQQYRAGAERVLLAKEPILIVH